MVESLVHTGILWKTWTSSLPASQRIPLFWSPCNFNKLTELSVSSLYFFSQNCLLRWLCSAYAILPFIFQSISNETVIYSRFLLNIWGYLIWRKIIMYHGIKYNLKFIIRQLCPKISFTTSFSRHSLLAISLGPSLKVFGFFLPYCLFTFLLFFLLFSPMPRLSEETKFFSCFIMQNNSALFLLYHFPPNFLMGSYTVPPLAHQRVL